MSEKASAQGIPLGGMWGSVGKIVKKRICEWAKRRVDEEAKSAGHPQGGMRGSVGKIVKKRICERAKSQMRRASPWGKCVVA
jgi:hypothetical protein